MLCIVCEGGEGIVSASALSESHTVNLLSVDFLCHLCQLTDKSLHTECVFAELVNLIDCDNEETQSRSKAFDVHLVSKVKHVCNIRCSQVTFSVQCNLNSLSHFHVITSRLSTNFIAYYYRVLL